MTPREDKVEVYVEIGPKRSLAVAIAWPGWGRSGKNEESAVEALIQAGPRYAQLLRSAKLAFHAPESRDQVHLRERVEGGASTDMAIPSIVLTTDAQPMSAAEVERASTILRACWDAFDRAVVSAQGKELRKGPRGGGRELEGIMRHVTEAELSYIQMIGIKLKWDGVAELPDAREALATSHEQVLQGLAGAAPRGTPPPGPRGGARWPARYFVRRVAYHVVDHTWEIEDRLQPAE
jgi:hypothetical protein